ncbi:uncharacterized protein PV09_04489 [Verruconis gallopava]|uniref:Enoyl-CoA hydratase domain-containing protein 3, mitochondrial n=1 Tax=Verruconis gallopava TaxID=253628 RepID=A0A0D1XNM6_9PEZI|nr:uncharacterized protein PV09_04489 [Verruconis gallopava]KIW04176.1 hypothetical protein PV09_04489 [Verruconis gallopava]
MSFPTLPRGAAYLKLFNPQKRNALSLGVLRDLKSQLTQYNTGASGELMMLPRRESAAGRELPQWLTSPDEWQKERSQLPKVLVLRSEGPVFSSGHDLREMRELGRQGTQETFSLCAEIMGMIKSCPTPVVCPIQGLASAAGFQLAMCTDYPIALADTKFQLPGMTIGLPCTSPATVVSRKIPPSLAYRMFATGDAMRADQLQGAVDVVPVPEHAESTDTRTKAFEQRVLQVVERLVDLPAQPQAFGKWAFWTQLTITDSSEMEWAGQMMVKHSAGDDAKEGISAFLEKRRPKFQT